MGASAAAAERSDATGRRLADRRDVRILNGSPASAAARRLTRRGLLGSPRRLRPVLGASARASFARCLSSNGGSGADEQGAAPMQNHLTKRHVAMAGLSLALLAVLCLSPSLLGDRVSAAIGGLGAADPGLLWVAGHRVRRHERLRRSRLARRASSKRLAVAVVDASARYAVGCGVNAIAPAHVGSALRVALFGRVTNGGCWTVSGAAAAVGVTRVVWLGALIAIGSAGGVLPLWPLLVIAAIVAGAGVIGVASRRLSLPDRSSSSSPPSGHSPPRRAISRSSRAGRSPAPRRRSPRRRRSSPRSASTIHSAPRSFSCPPSSSPPSSR